MLDLSLDELALILHVYVPSVVKLLREKLMLTGIGLDPEFGLIEIPAPKYYFNIITNF